MAQIGVDIGTYVFDASLKKITFSGVTLVDISVIAPIWNITRGVTIYNPAESGKGFTSFDGTDLILQFDTNTAGHSNTDKLKICVNIQEAALATEQTLQELRDKFTLQGDAVKVHVTNQIDLTTITGYLLDIKNSVATIDTNTDGIEGLIQDTIYAVNNGVTSINGNLANIITELQGIDANTDGIEAELLNILNKIIAAPATESTLSTLNGKIPTGLTMNGSALRVYVDNQVDLTTVTGYLLDIKNSVAAINTNTDTVESLISTVISDINTNASVNHADLLAIKAELVDIDANTDGQEALLTSILNKIIAAPATEATLLLIKAKTDNLDVPLSTINASNSFEQKLLQVDSVGSTSYLGYADAGTATSAATWAIKKIVETGSDVSITWADGNNSFDNIWDNRLALSYS